MHDRTRTYTPALVYLLLGSLLLCSLSSCRHASATGKGASGQALLDAVKVGDNHRAAVLLTEGVYTEVRDQRGNTPFLFAVRTGNIKIVKMMLSHDVDKNVRTASGKGPLELALDSGNENMVLCLLRGGISPDEIGHDSNPLLLKAVRFREMDSIKLLLKSGVTPSAAGKDGRTALHVAAEGGWVDCMEVLLASGADPNSRDDQGRTPLWAAVHVSGPVERWRAASRLLEAGAEVNVAAADKRSLLTEAVSRKLNREVIELINYGADLDVTNGEGEAPVEIAYKTGNAALVAALLSRGADGSTLFDEAFGRGDIGLARILFSSGLRPSIRQSSQATRADGIIAACVRKGQFEMVELCLRFGAKPEKKGKEGEYPLHMAVAMREASMVRVLLEYGANPNHYFARPVAKEFLDLTEKESMRWFLKNERRVTPLMMAANNGDTEIISSLLEYGAKKYVYSGRHHLYPVNFASRRGDVKAMQVILGQDPENEKYYAVLDLSEQRVRLYNAKDEVIFSSRVSTGKAGFRTPKGTYVITDKHRSHTSTIYGSSMPYFQRLSCSAFGFHAGNCPGYPASHGCIRMPYSAARKLFGMTPVGTRVVIQQ